MGRKEDVEEGGRGGRFYKREKRRGRKDGRILGLILINRGLLVAGDQLRSFNIPVMLQ